MLYLAAKLLKIDPENWISINNDGIILFGYDAVANKPKLESVSNAGLV